MDRGSEMHTLHAATGCAAEVLESSEAPGLEAVSQAAELSAARSQADGVIDVVVPLACC